MLTNPWQNYQDTPEQEDKENFYDLQAVMDVSWRNILLTSDMNVKVGSDNIGQEFTMGTEGLGIMNENGQMFTDC